MSRTARALGILATLLTGACAGNSNDSMVLTPDTALISVAGAPAVSHNALVQEGLREAARVAASRGYSHFVVIGTADATRSLRRIRSGDTLSNQNIPNDGTTFSSTNLSSSYIPGATFTTPDKWIQETRPGLDMTIRMYRKGEIDPALDGVWSSEAILAGEKPAD